MQQAVLALADGSVFYGRSVGAQGEVVGEAVFNTSMTGYQEIMTDPSYARQIVTLTYPHIGNVGVNEEDEESSELYLSALVVRDIPGLASSWRMQHSITEYLQNQGCVAIADIDTRQLTRILRNKGAQNACVMSGSGADAQAALQKARAFVGLKGMDLAKEVSTKQTYRWETPMWQPPSEPASESSQTAAQQWHVVAYDFGIKRNILRYLVEIGCRVTVVPAQTTAEQVLSLNPDGIFLSNGPGDPEPCDYAVAAVKALLPKRIPIFGICLGCQILALACGASTAKMKFGHHGANHPVLDLQTGKVLITSQNHGFAVDEKSLPDNVKATHRSLFDRTLQGIAHGEYPAFAFQGHPEASPGPQDVAHLFRQFVASIQHNA